MSRLNRQNVAAISFAIASASILQPAFLARADVQYTSGNYMQNFDSLFNPTTTGFNDTYNVSGATPQEWLDNTVSNAPTSDGLDGWYAAEPGPPALVEGTLTGSTAFVYYVSDGAPKASKGTLSGGLFDFGYSNAANGNVSDRALGVVATGTSGLTTVGVKLINNSNTTYTQLNIQYTGEEWFAGNMSLTTAKSLDFGYGIFNASGNSTVMSATNTDSALNFTAPVVNSGTTNGVALDGNAAANSETLSDTVQGPSVSWAPGQVLWLTWQISSSAAGGEGLAIDNLNFSAGITPAHNLAWSAGNGNWSTSSSDTNWLNTTSNATTYYSEGDFVVFGDAGVGNVSLNGNVTPGSLTFSNTGGTYVLSGAGSIVGNTSLVKTGAGTVVLTNTNTYAGGTSVDTGTLVINNDNNLGNSTTGITLTNNATLRTAAPITSARIITAGNGTVTLDSAGNDSTFGGLASTGGSLNQIGGGNLTVASINFNSSTEALGISGNLIITATSGTQAFAATGSYSGNIVLQGATRLSFEGGTVSGGGNIVVNAAGAVVNAAGTSNTTDIQNNIVINASNAHIGASSTDQLTVDGVISGNADIVYTNDPANGGKGLVVLDTQNTYTGQSIIDLGDTGVVRLGISNALPSGTALIFGDGNNTSLLGAFDLNGFDQTIASLATNYSGNKSQIAYGIVDTGFNSNPNTLTISGNATTTYAASIGNPPAFPTGDVSQIVGLHDANITLELGAANTGCLTLTGNNSYTGGTILDGGTLSVSTDANLGDPAGPLTFGGGTLEINSSLFTTSNRTVIIGAGGGTIQIDFAATTVTFNGPVTATDTLNQSGPGALQFAAASNSAVTINSAGTLQINGGATLTSGAIHGNSLVVNGSLVVSQATTKLLSNVSSLTLAGASGNWTGGIDLTNSRLIVEDTSANRAADILMYKDMAVNTGNNTVGIYSSTAAAANLAAGHIVETVAVVDNAVRLATDGPTASNFGTGVSNVDANSILITATYLGDANLDGVVDIKDLQVLANNWQKNVTDWSQGDFNGDGIVDIRDLQFIANDWQDGVGAAGAGSGESFGQALSLLPIFSGTSSVPEPGSLALLGLGGVVLASRRKRQ